MSDLFTMAVKLKGDVSIPTNKFTKSYGQANVAINSYSPPAFRVTTGHAVNTLRGIALFMSLYGYFEVDYDIYSVKDGHVGIGLVGRQRRQALHRSIR